MKYKIVNINETGERSVLIIYTGGTFGMIQDESGSLAPFNFGKVVERVPELRQLDIRLTVISFPTPLDSSNILIQDWKDMAYIIEENYEQYDAFVVLHGTDTMAYSASMLSYMLEGLNKPVIFTGAQMPIGSIRSDARENLITALEIASAHTDGIPIVSEVCVYFNYRLLRGSRSQKLRSSTFAAFESENYPVLAEAGIEIEFNYAALEPYNPNSELKVQNQLDPNVIILKIFPGITEHAVKAILSDPEVKGVVLESFGSGNIMKFDWFINCLKQAIEEGKIILNVSQCVGGEVEQGKYETSKGLNRIGVLSGGDITTEAAITKMMFLLGRETDKDRLKHQLTHSLAGEMDSVWE
ncbi:asparaginase [Ekhidna sp. MALMAid0563]|uniref:asparaginase n=1 Tax=Ekhidna sp. MALMAid0563 TaxID=3143937 RepID=UPI0032DEDE30